MILLLALLPTIVLLIYIYKKDKLEKESRKILRKCFIWGMIIVVPIIALEEFLSFIFEDFFVVVEETDNGNKQNNSIRIYRCP